MSTLLELDMSFRITKVTLLKIREVKKNSLKSSRMGLVGII